ncbi:MAG: hypothetical protein FD130_2674, partial [Halothiobacillaceae bacterium]
MNIYYSMVLDASYSMTQHTPPAFGPMKEAARDSYQTVHDTWQERPGEAKFAMIWFDEVINQTQYNTNTARAWMPDDIRDLPEPQPGASTKLFSATETMAKFLAQERQRNIFTGPRDQYVMVVFSDGADNYSF